MIHPGVEVNGGGIFTYDGSHGCVKYTEKRSTENL